MESAPTPTEARRAELTARETAILAEIAEIIAEQRADERELKTTPARPDDGEDDAPPLDFVGLRIRAIETRLKSLRSRHTLAARELSETRAALAALPIAVPDGPPPDEATVKAKALRHADAVISGALPVSEASREAQIRAYLDRAWSKEGDAADMKSDADYWAQYQGAKS